MLAGKGIQVVQGGEETEEMEEKETIQGGSNP